MFVTFFISDKGRKFFRFFRQLMITGKTVKGKSIKPTKLKYTFFLLNACIEACYNKKVETTSIDKRTKWTLALDTNNIIKHIHKGIPKKYHKKNIKEVGQAGNPMSYYAAIISYLGDYSIYLQELYVASSSQVTFWNKLMDNKYKDQPVMLPNYGLYPTATINDTPDIFVINVWDNESKDFIKSSTFMYNKATYVLDSIIIRDTLKAHFCALLTCNGREYGYDGASFSRISEFSWKKIINKNQKWTFEGSNFVDSRLKRTKENIKWNFKSGYQLLLYYRVN